MADKNEVKKTEIVKIPVAKRHKILDDITAQITGTEKSGVMELIGHKFFMTTINADEEVWADSHTNTSSPMAVLTSIKAPKLAAAIKSIDGVKIDDMFEFSDESSQEDKNYHMQSQYRKRYWEMTQLLLWLCDRPDNVINDLYKFYLDLSKQRDESWDELKKSSARTPGGK